MEIPEREDVLLSLAGFDPTSGAGVTLDLKVFHRHGFHGMGIPTALTIQNSRRVKKIHCLSAVYVLESYDYLRDDVKFSGIKIGMIGSKDNILAIEKILSRNPKVPVVIDPVLKSSSGKWLLDKKSIPAYMASIQGKASLLTPNLEEAAWISGMKVASPEEMHASAEKIYEITSIPCLIKGGHLPDQNVDILFDGKRFRRFKNKKLHLAVHGTGCFLSSSILCHLACGRPLDRAIALAKRATHEAMKGALKIGKGQLIIEDVP